MASTPDGRRLTEAHRLAQARIGQSAATDLLAAFDALDPDDLDGTTPRWLRVARQIVAGRHQQSAALAVRYYVAFRQLEAGRAALFMPEIATLQVAAVDTSLTVTGPVAIKQAMTRGEPLDRAVDVARAVQAREGIRHTLAGGRDTITRAVAADPVALGWARTTSGQACSFCRILASRGPVYSEATVDFEAHGGCVLGTTTVGGPRFQAGFRRWYEGELVIVRTADGVDLAITPKHPVLTHLGWVDAGDLSESHHLVHRRCGDLASPGVPQEDHVPSAIEDVWRAASVDGLGSMPVAAEDFHGDGVGTQGHVDVVAAHGLLSGVGDTSGVELIAQVLGARTGVPTIAPQFAGESGLRSLFLGVHASTGGCVCGRQLLLTPLGAQGRLVEQRGLPQGSALDTSRVEPALHHGPGDAVPSGQVLLRFAPQVGPDEEVVRWADSVVGGPLASGPRFDPPTGKEDAHGVAVKADLGARLLERLAGQVELRRPVELRRIGRWSGHVYNLQTVEGWYDANGTVVSNCSCSAEPAFSRDAPWPPGSREFRDLWDGDAAALARSEGIPQAVAFRRLVEGRT